MSGTAIQGLRRLFVLGVAATAMTLISPSLPQFEADGGLHLVATASAQGSGGQQHGKGGMSTPGGAGKGEMGVGKGGAGKGGIGRVLSPSAEEDSDRPPWAGVKGGKAGGGGKPAGAGSVKGALYADLYLIVRDSNGVPVLVDGYPQVYAFTVDSAGNLIPLVVDGQSVIIPRDEEGDLATTVTVNGTTYNVVPAEVELGRTNVARSPTRVLEKALDSVATAIASATSVTVDASGRLVIDGATVDSPIENLALYLELMNPTVLSGTLDLTKLPSSYSTAAFLAASADKTGVISVDYVVYLNSILRVNTVVDGTVTSYYDFSSVSYDRYTTWKDVTAEVLVYKDGVYVPTVVNIYETVFNSTQWVDPTVSGGADDFAKMADDYLQVIEFLHDNAVR
ncbi:MAG: hypothetical protein KIT81_12395 [Alphaproteobacteria bacterium]|nr:hypothetical protein [Alphaproteobacteria bacterium]